jgi:hypothetical protein
MDRCDRPEIGDVALGNAELQGGVDRDVSEGNLFGVRHGCQYVQHACDVDVNHVFL